MPTVIANTLARLRSVRGVPVPVGTVVASAEFRRVEGLPRRVLDLMRTDDLTELVRRPGGTMRLFPVQSAALAEMAIQNGLLAPIPVGQGKELICLLAPLALDSKRTVLLVPPELRGQVQDDMRRYGEHFMIPRDRITVIAYSELSLAKNTGLLERLAPDLIVANECHSIKRPQSARTKRVKRYMKAHPECRFVALSGTMTDKSVKDYAHLSEWALRSRSPLPGNWQEVQDWSGALDVKPEYLMRPGALERFCQGEESVRQGYGRRLVETPGVISVANVEIGVSLYIRRVAAEIPPVVTAQLEDVRKNWRVGEDEIADADRRAEILREVACGFYYRWLWPGGVPDYEWLGARSAWNQAVRDKLSRAREGMDSEFLLYQAARRWWEAEQQGIRPVGLVWESPEWLAWSLVKDRPEPPKEAVWLSEYLCHDALRRAEAHVKKKRRTIIWVEHVAVGEKLAELSGLDYYGAGTNALEAKTDIVIASRRAQGTGKNLQHRYSANIYTLVCSGKEMEQSIGRTHRTGQEADEVWVDWYGHTPEMTAKMERALAEARYDHETMQKPLKLLYGTHLVEE